MIFFLKLLNIFAGPKKFYSHELDIPRPWFLRFSSKFELHAILSYDYKNQLL